MVKRSGYKYGARLRELRAAQHLTQVQLAARAGVAEATIGKMESGQLDPHVSTVERVATALGYELGALFERPGTFLLPEAVPAYITTEEGLNHGQ